MANKRIDELTLLDKANITPASDVLAMVDVSDSNNTKKVTIESAVQSTLRDAGAANGVLYLNGSKVATSGSALMFDGANLGIGTSSPRGKLDVSGSIYGAAPIFSIVAQPLAANDNGTLTLQCGGGTTPSAGTSISLNGYDGGTNIRFSTANTERMRLDASGNLGLGVTPSAWSGSQYNLQIAGSQNIVFNDQYGSLGSNYYYASSAYRYIQSSQSAAKYTQAGGVHQWFTAPSGTAGNAISFTQAMTLDTGGNLLVGRTSGPDGKLDVYVSSGWARAVTHNAAGTQLFDRFAYSTTAIGSITGNNTSVAYNTSSDYRLKDNQAPLTGSGAFIDALKPKTWNWKADGAKGVGFIAHEVQEVSPTSVVGEKDATRIEQYEVSPAVPATYDEEGNELTPAVEAVMGEREVPAYQAMEYGSAEFIANIIAELQSLRKRVAALEAK